MDLTWPDTWMVVDWAFCQEGSGSLAWWGWNPHHLELSWPCNNLQHLFLALTLIFDVHGYGQLYWSGTPSLRLGCPPGGYSVIPVGGFAEAGAGCNYTNQRCVDFWYNCIPYFEQQQLVLESQGDAVRAAPGWSQPVIRPVRVHV